MKLRKNFITYLNICFIALAVCIMAYVLFSYPQPGVADQGDFDRVLNMSGLELTKQNKSDPKFDRFFNYIVTDYSISETGIKNVTNRIFVCSLIYLTTTIRSLCKTLGLTTFKTNYLAIAYAIIYTCSIYIIIKYINIKDKATLTLFTLLCIFIFFDGNYLVWFNSLYGEPMMITTLLLYISSWIYYIYYKYILKLQEKIFSKVLLIFIASFLFVGSKMQVIASLPFIIVMLTKLLWKNRYVISRGQLYALCLSFCLVILYPLGINLTNALISKDTQYNSVFYGVLKDSKSPRQDLIDMNLNPDMAVEAGKHSYLNKNKYVKYVPHSDITEKEFYSKMNNSKLIKFYIAHPVRLIQAMEYTSNHAFSTSTSLGHYQISYSEKPIRTFNRFTLWSYLRGTLLPKKLGFIILVYIGIGGLSLFTYIKNKNIQEIKSKIELFWSVMFIGLLQFPMPFIGNGQADTAKQLFLFNFVFDIMLIVSISWTFFKVYKSIYLKFNKILNLRYIK